MFTDLDGSLLDHHTYSYDAATPTLSRLSEERIPLIFVSSKTRAEMSALRAEMGVTHPFIVENGAAVFVPEGYFSTRPADTHVRDGYWVREFSEGRDRWLDLLESARGEFAGEFDCFHWAGTQGVAEMTGLSPEQAEMANRREYSEAVRWLGTEARKIEFVDSLTAGGATVQQGGRFLGVAGRHDKGEALTWLRACYQQEQPAVDVCDLAVGDSLRFHLDYGALLQAMLSPYVDKELSGRAVQRAKPTRVARDCASFMMS